MERETYTVDMEQVLQEIDRAEDNMMPGQQELIALRLDAILLAARRIVEQLDELEDARE